MDVFLHFSNCGKIVAVGSASGDVTVYSKDLKVTYIPHPTPLSIIHLHHLYSYSLEPRGLTPYL